MRNKRKGKSVCVRVPEREGGRERKRDQIRALKTSATFVVSFAQCAMLKVIH